MATSWFYVEDNQKVGPINEDILIDLMASQKLNEESYVWRKGFENWTKIKDVEELLSYLGASGSNDQADLITDNDLIEEEILIEQSEGDDSAANINSPFSQSADQVQSHFNSLNWYQIDRGQRIFIVRQETNGTMYGPYSFEILQQLYQDGRIESKTQIYATGMDHWMYLAEIPMYEDLFLESARALSDKEKKMNRNRPMLVNIQNGKKSTGLSGLARDLTVGGTQVLISDSDFVAAKGDVITLSLVSPLNAQVDKSIKGKIERVLDGGQGFFVRFQQIDDKIKKMIDQYLDSSV